MINYEDVRYVEEVIHSENAQEYLDLGWTLLNVVPVRTDEGEGYFCYALGWASQAQVKRPEKKSSYASIPTL